VIIINKGIVVADDKLSTLQRGNKDHHTVIVQFKESIDKASLEKLKEVSQVEHSGHIPNSYRIQTGNPEIVRKQIVDMAQQQNLNIISLQSESQSLESIFKTLTN